VTGMPGINAVDHRPAIGGEGEQRADTIHAPSIAKPRHSRSDGATK
jgi:hypothetical protein